MKGIKNIEDKTYGWAENNEEDYSAYTKEELISRLKTKDALIRGLTCATY